MDINSLKFVLVLDSKHMLYRDLSISIQKENLVRSNRY